MADYTKDPRVLEACGLRLQKYTDPDENYWMDGKGHCRGKRPVPTFSELWEGLCKATPPWGDPHLIGMFAVVLYYNTPDEKWYKATEYGSLTNAVAAALHWVLQQKEG